MQPSRHSVVSTDRPSGFTLIETLLALALCTVLLAAAWSSTQLYWTWRVRSQGQLESSGLQRAICDDLRMDIRRVLAPAPPQPELLTPVEDETFPQEVLPQITEAEFQARLLQLTPLADSQPVYFAGGPDWVLVLSDRTSPRFPVAYSSQQLRHTLWCTCRGQRLRLPVAGAGDSLTYATLNLPAVKEGILRLDLPARELAHADGQVLDHLPLERRIADLQFSFFDGVEWLEAWAPNGSFAIPLAVRVECRLSGNEMAQPPVIIAIPQANTVPPEVRS